MVHVGGSPEALASSWVTLLRIRLGLNILGNGFMPSTFLTEGCLCSQTSK